MWQWEVTARSWFRLSVVLKGMCGGEVKIVGAIFLFPPFLPATRRWLPLTIACHMSWWEDQLHCLLLVCSLRLYIVRLRLWERWWYTHEHWLPHMQINHCTRHHLSQCPSTTDIQRIRLCPTDTSNDTLVSAGNTIYCIHALVDEIKTTTMTTRMTHQIPIHMEKTTT